MSRDLPTFFGLLFDVITSASITENVGSAICIEDGLIRVSRGVVTVCCDSPVIGSVVSEMLICTLESRFGKSTENKAATLVARSASRLLAVCKSDKAG